MDATICVLIMPSAQSGSLGFGSGVLRTLRPKYLPGDFTVLGFGSGASGFATEASKSKPLINYEYLLFKN
jgi:hypothetical protein